MERIKNNLVTILIIAVAAVAAFSIYLFVDKFGLGYWGTVERWGATGDFFGGILNPIIAFTTLILLVYTLRQNNTALEQNKEALENSREELELTRGELEKSAAALSEQVSVSEQQRFEGTFFNLLNAILEITNRDADLYSKACRRLSQVFESQTLNYSSDMFFKALRDDKTIHQKYAYNCFQHLRTHQATTLQQHSQVIRLLFELLLLIDSQAEETQKLRYVQIVKASITPGLLPLLVIAYAAEPNQEINYCSIVGKTALFEYLSSSLHNFRNGREFFHLTVGYFPHSAFGGCSYTFSILDSNKVVLMQ